MVGCPKRGYGKGGPSKCNYRTETEAAFPISKFTHPSSAFRVLTADETRRLLAKPFLFGELREEMHPQKKKKEKDTWALKVLYHR